MPEFVGECAVPPTPPPTAKPPTFADSTAPVQREPQMASPRLDRHDTAVAWRPLSNDTTMQRRSTRVYVERAGQPNPGGPTEAHASWTGPARLAQAVHSTHLVPSARAHAHAPARASAFGRAVRTAPTHAPCGVAWVGRPIATAVVRSVPSRRVEHQRLPAGIVEDCHGSGVQERCRHLRLVLPWKPDEGLRAERLLRCLSWGRLQRARDGRTQLLLPAAVCQCAARAPHTHHPVGALCMCFCAWVSMLAHVHVCARVLSFLCVSVCVSEFVCVCKSAHVRSRARPCVFLWACVCLSV
jgi:hypothetical protein